MPVQMPLFDPQTDWRPPDMSALPSWAGARRVAYDIETKDPLLKQLGIGTRRGGYVVGFSFAIEDGPSAYLPIRHEGGGNVDEAKALRYLREQARNFTGELVGANVAYDLDYSLNEGIDFRSVKYIRDVQIADPLIWELHDRYSLNEIAARHGLPGKNTDTLELAAKAYGLSAKSDLHQLPAEYVGEYAEQDARALLPILRRQERLIDEQDLWDVYNLESRVTPVLVRMRRRGIRVDLNRLEQIEDWSLREEARCLEEVRVATGVRIGVGDCMNSRLVAPALEAVGVKLGKTSVGTPSIDKDVLASVDHPVAKSLAWARKVHKLRTTFAASVRKYITDGRIHCTYNQIAREDEKGDQRGARYGRLSCVDPNLQQQPARDEFAKRWRSIYLPEEGALFVSNDYSQQEPRWTTHFAAECNLPGARDAAQAYRDDPLLDNHDFMARITGLPRKFAKNVYLGLCYGEGGAKLSRDCGLPTRWALSTGRKVEFYDTREEALAERTRQGEGYVFETAGEEGQAIIDKFDARAPFIRQLARKCQDVAASRGYIVTKGGRRLHFPQRPDGSYDWTHKALNRLIQGTSADQTKRALVALDAEGHRIALQIHDEIAGSVPDRTVADRWAEIMANAMPARVPFRVDVEIGPSWGEAA
jgi:DNA polymerase I-like protein with 3'-5' exonuclease and polymerase domains